MRIFIFIFFIFFSNSILAELIKPSPKLLAHEVISIQLSALQNNNIPYNDAGIEQTWEFAHPANRIYTGPLSNFTRMMYSRSYYAMIQHLNHKIIMIESSENISLFFVELTDKNYNKFGFQWVVEKVLSDGQFKNCWMTTMVSAPLPLAKST